MSGSVGARRADPAPASDLAGESRRAPLGVAAGFAITSCDLDPLPAASRVLSARPGPGHYLAVAALLCTGCLLRSDLAGCASDRDCRMDRVCEYGRCVWPAYPGAAAAPRPGPVVARPLPVTVGGQTSTAPAPAPRPTPAEAGPPGAMFRFGPEHRGRSPYRAPTSPPKVLWSVETRGPVTSSPAMAADGSVVVGSHDGELYLVGRDGKLGWHFATSDLIFSSPALVGGGIAYIGSDDDHLYALDLGGRRLLWRFRIGSCPQSVGVGPEASRCDVDAGPTVGPDGVIYTGGDAIYAINADGTLRWRFVTGGHVASAPALLPDGTAVAGSQDNLIYAVAPNGAKRWDFRAADDVESSPAISEDGTIYVGSDDGKLYALSPTGQMLWAFSTGGDIRASPAIGPDGTIYVGAFDSLMYAIKRDGTLSWTFRTGDRIVSSALVDAAGTVIFGSQDDRLYALDSEGHHRWSVELGGDVDSSPVLAADGTIYVGSDDRRLYAVGVPGR
jgi:outer membrane protein assembly factor BamB